MPNLFSGHKFGFYVKLFVWVVSHLQYSSHFKSVGMLIGYTIPSQILDTCLNIAHPWHWRDVKGSTKSDQKAVNWLNSHMNGKWMKLWKAEQTVNVTYVFGTGIMQVTWTNICHFCTECDVLISSWIKWACMKIIILFAYFVFCLAPNIAVFQVCALF